jgi:hypothetical protein
MKKLLAFLAMYVLALPAFPEAAYDWEISGVHITAIEATYMPSTLVFTVDANAGSCGVGARLTWSSSAPDQATMQANHKAIYALLLASKLSGSTVRMFGSNSGCLLKFIHSARNSGPAVSDSHKLAISRARRQQRPCRRARQQEKTC